MQKLLACIKKYSVLYCNCCSVSVCTRTRTCTSGFKEVPWSGCFPYHVTFAPQLTSMVVISVLWSVLYNANPNTGLINSILVSLGMSPIKFLSDASTAMNSIIFMSAWQGAGYQMMIFLAGLQGIPRDQYEAASVDGATKFKQFLYITIPGLKGTIKYVIMITMIQAMKLFTQPYIMTQGGPKNSTKTLVYYIYTQGFQKGNFGYACSIAAVFFVIVVCMSMAMKKVTAATD